MLEKLRTPKKLEQHHMKTIAKLVELVFEDKKDIEDSLLSLWEQQLNGELGLLKIENTVEQLKQAIDWSEQNK